MSTGLLRIPANNGSISGSSSLPIEEIQHKTLIARIWSAVYSGLKAIKSFFLKIFCHPDVASDPSSTSSDRVLLRNEELAWLDEFKCNPDALQTLDAIVQSLLPQPKQLFQNSEVFKTYWLTRDQDTIQCIPLLFDPPDITDGFDAISPRLRYFSLIRAASLTTQTSLQGGIVSNIVDVIVSLNTPTPVATPDSGIEGRSFLMPDSCQTAPAAFAEQLVDAVTYMYQQIQAGKRVGVHCTEGRNRSALAFMLCSAALNPKDNITYDEAFQMAQNCQRSFMPHKENQDLVKAEFEEMIYCIRQRIQYQYQKRHT
ncbi:MAG: Dual specificity phosphatase, catalytic domain [Parachlamydiales bacterium]|nr:Dual specificity phosphatase, catalytic domain [Parachlamydiales bacterium]